MNDLESIPMMELIKIFSLLENLLLLVSESVKEIGDVMTEDQRTQFREYYSFLGCNLLDCRLKFISADIVKAIDAQLSDGAIMMLSVKTLPLLQTLNSIAHASS